MSSSRSAISSSRADLDVAVCLLAIEEAQELVGGKVDPRLAGLPARDDLKGDADEPPEACLRLDHFEAEEAEFAAGQMALSVDQVAADRAVQAVEVVERERADRGAGRPGW